jgi:hypothetical protein
VLTKEKELPSNNFPILKMIGSGSREAMTAIPEPLDLYLSIIYTIGNRNMKCPHQTIPDCIMGIRYPRISVVILYGKFALISLEIQGSRNADNHYKPA